jgi:hypothetical protein
VLIGRFTYALYRPSPRVIRLVGYCIGAFAAAILTRPATGETYLSDASVELFGTGPRVSRNCTVLLKPAQTFGDNLAPRLALVTSGASQLSFGIDRPSQYSSLVIVQNNIRRTFIGSDNASIEQFRLSDVGKVIRSQRLFFVTAQRSDSGKFVSSRYERIDFDAILANVEAACPFDAESLMINLSSRERAERALSISPSDFALIRWALNKKYSGSSNKPEPSTSLSQQERIYLKRYASEKALPLSQYLTAEIARKLVAEGQLTANSPQQPQSTAQRPVTPKVTAMLLGTSFTQGGALDGIFTGELVAGQSTVAAKAWYEGAGDGKIQLLIKTDSWDWACDELPVTHPSGILSCEWPEQIEPGSYRLLFMYNGAWVEERIFQIIHPSRRPLSISPPNPQSTKPLAPITSGGARPRK